MAKQIDARMHSAEHLLNQAMIRLMGTRRCFNAHIEKKKSKCDYAFEGPLQKEMLARVEQEVNRIIEADLPVMEEFLTKADAAAAYDMGKVPSQEQGAIRIVHIGDYDACPCSGPHVASTRQIGRFRITSFDHREGVLRLRFRLDPADKG